MKIAFTGDLVLQNIEGKPNAIFEEFKNKLAFYEAKLCTNLESPFISQGMEPIKDKITLHAYEDKITYLKYLSPLFVNLSNNHINDFGNLSSKLTMLTLEKAKLHHFGVGFKTNKQNQIIDEKNKIIYIAFSTRSTDFTGSRLFAEEDFIGPYPPSLDQIHSSRKQYPGFKMIVNIHWGIEDIPYPEPEKRKLAYELVDQGADLIIGHHPHIIQPYEIYKGKYIFYSLGNFYFPDLYHIDNKEVLRKALPHHKKGVVPIFNVKDEIYLESIIEVKLDENNCLKVFETKLIALGVQNVIYELVYPFYKFVLFNMRRTYRVLMNPELVVKKLF